MRSQELYKIRERVVEELKKLKRELNAEIYLFGSYTRGTHIPDSDVDIIVVSRQFEEMSLPERVAYVRLRLPQDIGFDIIPLTPEEFKEKLKKSTLIKEASKYWIKI
ncbi:MAG TPA: nucleotidyltransferase domain-containing protein [Thermoprotei archaeon]|nr:MAG: nucleotidyltransferase domain-containing protein [Thermoprotei archaeon]HDI74762.1 nucleotidyltransferase domain-containing protein [Thermoprotei archaeon]